ncbi:helix-turn-helix domain-containing protein [Prescottella equi]|uniref:helix-turn-helix domain-containing protein n=1 Tax=Rhodococcus hoagii TaxID=43767 RepID=UPI001F1AE432|nr:helix-turn-helix domain-containing protein [Prescottella equi]
MRLRAVAEHVAAGSDLTRAAVAAGFSDSAHLSRAFKRNFGLTPSALLGMTVDRDAWPTGGPTGGGPRVEDQPQRSSRPTVASPTFEAWTFTYDPPTSSTTSGNHFER